VTEVEIVGPVPIHLVAGGRFRRLGGPRTWRIRNETADFNYGETAYAIVDTLLRKEWPSVKKWRGGPDTFATEEDEGVMPRFASSTLPIEE
jgi:hypothetical protein